MGGDTVLVDQPSSAPSAKWVAGAATGGLAIVLVWLLAQFGIEMPGEVAGFLVLGLAKVAEYVKRNRAAADDPGKHSAGP